MKEENLKQPQSLGRKSLPPTDEVCWIHHLAWVGSSGGSILSIKDDRGWLVQMMRLKLRDTLYKVVRMKVLRIHEESIVQELAWTQEPEAISVMLCVLEMMSWRDIVEGRPDECSQDPLKNQ